MSEQHKGWIGVDLDGTLAHHDGWKGVEHIGEPVPRMLARVKAWLAEGREVRILTARVGGPRPDGEAITARHVIQQWTMKHLGVALPVTATKDYSMVELWDDRAVSVIPNAGIRSDEGLAVIKEEFARLDMERANWDLERSDMLVRQRRDNLTIRALQVSLEAALKGHSV